MVAELVKSLSDITGNDLLTVFLISLLPVAEIRGAIPAAYTLGINPWVALAVSWAGSTLVSPVLVATLTIIFSQIKKGKRYQRFRTFYDNAVRKSSKIEKKKSLKSELLALFAFVAVPLPMTGVWSGSAIAAAASVKKPAAVASVALGNLSAGAVVSLLCMLCPGYTDIVLDVLTFVFAGITILYVLCTIITGAIKNKKNNCVKCK